MSPAWWSIVISSVAPLLLLISIISQLRSARLARQQQLRIEKHREDPTFPLEPPPSRLRMFIRNQFAVILCVGFNLGALTLELTRRDPLTVFRVLVVSSLVGSTVFVVLMEVFSYLLHRVLEIIDDSDKLTWKAINVIADAVKNIAPKADKQS